MPSALPATARSTRSKLLAPEALGAVSPIVLPLWALASSVSIASLAFTGIVSFLRSCLRAMPPDEGGRAIA